jgi:glycosyltransferase involved in cell wall biosynthesis
VIHTRGTPSAELAMSFLSVVVVFHNMPKEGKRTLFSLTRSYQQNLKSLDYEVIAIDNGSTEPIEEEWVRACGDHFRYVYFDAKHPSPCAALNYGVSIANGDFVTLCIDGARILSPGILHLAHKALGMVSNPFIYTISMHIGKKPQNYLVEEGYRQSDEDKLLEGIQWQENGYLLFRISSVAPSSRGGYFSHIAESNCVTISRMQYEAMGGFDEGFISPGGGLANLDFFNRSNEINGISPVLLLGEATFHQLHGGVATNVPLNQHPWHEMLKEYERIKGQPYIQVNKDPIYLGAFHKECRHLLIS